ncbi:MAG: ATP-binding protein [Pseudomonadota bacterium]
MSKRATKAADGARARGGAAADAASSGEADASMKAPSNRKMAASLGAGRRLGAPRLAAAKGVSAREDAAAFTPQAPSAADLGAGVYETAWNGLPFPAMILAPDNAILSVNVATEHYLGHSAKTLRRMRLDDFCVEGARILDLLEQARRGMPSLSEYGVELQLVDREPALVDVQAAALFDPRRSMLLVIQPRSVAAAMDRSLANHGSARSLSGLSTMLAHEIKNPLAGISGAAQLLEMSLGEEEGELLRLIQDEVDRIRLLIDRMDAFGQNAPAERRPVNIHEVLEQARRAAAAGFGRHVRFREVYDPSLPPVPGDRAQLLQAISNLLKNAAEAAPRQGAEVVLRTAFRPGVKIAVAGGGRESLPLEVSVQDNGSGVPEALSANVFDPFVTTKSNGSGLGLALVAKIVGDHGGVIEHARQNDRTIFRMLLPVWTGPEGEEAAGAAAAAMVPPRAPE